ncbi:MAG TPA: VOC family protein [Micromonosporaceae bacterium]|nr:VOC family protein [Micromonosporaceae bacterium]
MRRITAVQINVDDLDKAIDFYVDKLGFDVETKRYYPQSVKLAQPHFSLLLYKVNDSSRLEYPSAARVLVNVETDDLDRDIAGLLAQDVEVIHPEPVRCPVGRYAAVRDPAGNVLELIEYDQQVLAG